MPFRDTGEPIQRHPALFSPCNFVICELCLNQSAIHSRNSGIFCFILYIKTAILIQKAKT